MRIRAMATLLAMTALTACAEGNSIYHAREVRLDRAAVVTVDAKQRNVYLNPEEIITTTANGTTTVTRSRRSCAEAAPDVFSAISASASLEASLTDRAGRAAAAIAENAGTIERTQTINLLRESMFRTCERYLSGAISRPTLIVQAARDQRTMLALLAIEQLTRTVRPPSTILAASGTNVSVANGESAALIKQFAKEKSDAAAAKDTAAATFSAARDKSDCDKIKVAPAAEPELGLWSNCVAARTESQARDAEYKAASDRLDNVIKATSSGGATTAATTPGTNVNGQGGAAPSDTVLAAVADNVTKITLQTSIDEPLMFCIAYLSEPPTGMDKDAEKAIRETCLKIVMLRAQTDETFRAGLLGFNLDGQEFQFLRFSPDPAGQNSGMILQNYLGSAVPAEAKRRLGIVQQAAKALGLPSDAMTIGQIAESGPARDRVRLLAEVRRRETNAAGLAVLNPR